jgi:hypothetical protein
MELSVRPTAGEVSPCSGTSSWGCAPPLNHHPEGRWRMRVGVLTLSPAP